uniref:Uncharacterized protein n=1 Tax=Arundo donax TaxID=35708 RepID=A0A0A9AFE4_ARUDO
MKNRHTILPRFGPLGG